ncbi:unnamed protein product [Prunus armeniaca]
MLDCKSADTPIVENHKLGVYVDQVPTDRERYQRLVGRLIYLSLTRPDIAYVVSIASQFMHSPNEDHMTAVMHIMSYLKCTHGRGYTDADYAGNVIDRRSTSGYFTFVGGNLVTWRSKKQNVVYRPSTESKYRGIAQGVCEILWLRWVLAEIGFRLNAATKLHLWHAHIEGPPSRIITSPLADMLTHAMSKRRFEDSLDKLGITDVYAPT